MFVALRIDYCNAVLAGAPKATTNKLQRDSVLNAAVRVVSGSLSASPTDPCRDSSVSMFTSEPCTSSVPWTHSVQLHG